MTELLRLDEVAGRLRVSRRTVEREIAAGHLRALHIGRKRFVTSNEVEALIAAAMRRGRVA